MDGGPKGCRPTCDNSTKLANFGVRMNAESLSTRTLAPPPTKDFQFGGFFKIPTMPADDDNRELRQASERLATSTTGLLHNLAHEPSVGLYYVVEHIQRSVPALVADKVALRHASEQLRGAALDAGYALEDMSVATSGGTLASLKNTANLMAHASVLSRSLARQQRGGR